MFFEISKFFWKIFISLLGMKSDFRDFFQKNFSCSIVPLLDKPKYPLYKGGYGGEGGVLKRGGVCTPTPVSYVATKRMIATASLP